MKSVFDAQRMAAMVQTKRGKQSLRDAASEIGVSAATLQRIERAEISDIAIALLVSDWLALPLQDFVEQQQMNITPTTEQLIEQIRLKAQVTGYGPTGLRPRNTTLAVFWCLPATSEQIRVTEDLLGFPLPKELTDLYLSLANGGFGPAAGLRGTIGGYGTRYTALPNGGMFYNEESMVKNHSDSASLVDLEAYSPDQWQQKAFGSKVLLLPAEVWPRQIIPLCDWGDCVEICCDQRGFLCYWYASERPGYYELEKTVKPFNSWLQEWAVKKV
ncbi:hypothetical protein KSD_61940 [Ktedonobacter sp. SOSP1-85]|uniref:SMI1/KNR4 family protein n=1 Tax=Ktedonobacter sp. SOSP1-85 TaxID=2778367 RepID=UPI0019161B93|nr:SMI1/KNR4 family protein [Ktedonobacter sp. SOSP1-85]GHO78423.1 hypothetical protein KSD_61940 [Ktedonobacter sp. SOSP1-85]